MTLRLQNRNYSLNVAWSKPLHGAGGGGEVLLTLWVLYEGDTGMCQNSVGILFLTGKNFIFVLLKSTLEAYSFDRDFSLLTGDTITVFSEI